jgi:hypothetical protein
MIQLVGCNLDSDGLPMTERDVPVTDTSKQITTTLPSDTGCEI